MTGINKHSFLKQKPPITFPLKAISILSNTTIVAVSQKFTKKKKPNKHATRLDLITE